MTTEERISKLFGLDDAGWTRHANPWSGWTRFLTCLPMLVLAIWSRQWLEGWSAIPILLALGWIWINPRVFGPVKDDHHWITKGVFGERLWTRRHRIEIPLRHRRMPHLLNVAALAGLPCLVWGLIRFEPWPCCFGMAVIIGSKFWYIDRMAMLYEDVVAERPEFRFRSSSDPPRDGKEAPAGVAGRTGDNERLG